MTMAAMITADRAECHGNYMRNPDVGEVFGLTKVELRAALDAADDWANTNAAAFNTALPLPARTALSTAQKARLLLWVVRWRYLKGA
jgi:hypothetical protein